MSRNHRLILQLPRHTDHTPTPLFDTVVSYNELSYFQPPPLQYQLAVIQVQLGALTIGAAPEQADDQSDRIEEDDEGVELDSEEAHEEIEVELEEPQQ